MLQHLLAAGATTTLVINFGVASFLALKGQPIEHREVALLFLGACFTLLMTGPGKYSVDGAMGK